MKYISTGNINTKVSFGEAVVKGLADDGGLFFPEEIPQMEKDFFNNIEKKSLPEIAFEVSRHFIDDIDKDALKRIVNTAIDFPAPVVSLSEQYSVLELFHGRTLAFKDFGARFLAGVLDHYMKQSDKRCTILVATSGDTGSAVASGFYGKDNIDVVILYPSGKVSNIQEQQLTTFGGNITALEINGTFDDCQRLVKEAFMDEALNRNYFLTSANSINIGRLIPQSFYYFNAWKELKNKFEDIVFSVPCGNLGNLTSGLIAQRMGLPVKYFLGALNRNDVFMKYLNTGSFNPVSSQMTISNAMDVGNPSNLERIRFMYNDEASAAGKIIRPYSFSDDETRRAIKEGYDKYNYFFDPHGAVAYLAAEKDRYSHNDDNHYVILETAHPAKFGNEMKVLNAEVNMPERLREYLNKKKESVIVERDYESFKHKLSEILLSRAE